MNVEELVNPSDAGITTYINHAMHNYYCFKVKKNNPSEARNSHD